MSVERSLPFFSSSLPPLPSPPLPQPTHHTTPLHTPPSPFLLHTSPPLLFCHRHQDRSNRQLVLTFLTADFGKPRAKTRFSNLSPVQIGFSCKDDIPNRVCSLHCTSLSTNSPMNASKTLNRRSCTAFSLPVWTTPPTHQLWSQKHEHRFVTDLTVQKNHRDQLS